MWVPMNGEDAFPLTTDREDFHPYRRAWATARKHLPVADVAAAGGWKSPMTVLRHYQRHYQQTDEATLYAVVADPH